MSIKYMHTKQIMNKTTHTEALRSLPGAGRMRVDMLVERAE